jgi:Protein of unknown function (DUF2971)
VSEIPARLYKYYRFNGQSLANLKKQTVYFAPPASFNDPYDCAIYPRIGVPSDVECEQIRAHYLQKSAGNVEAEDWLRKASIAGIQDWFPRLVAEPMNALVNWIYGEKGILCLSKNNSDLLMWSHYADAGKGFCLEFSSNHTPFNAAKEVRYSQEPPTLDAASYVLQGAETQAEKLFCSKGASWHYEQEWRVIHNQAGTEFTYPAEALTGIFFGSEMPIEWIEIVCLVLKGQNKNVAFWRGNRSKQKLVIEFEQFTYTDFLSAKLGTAAAAIL